MNAEKLNKLGFNLSEDVNIYSMLTGNYTLIDDERINILRDVITEYNESKPLPKHPVLTSRQAADKLLPLMKGKQQEECWAIFLNHNRNIIAIKRLTIGGLDSTIIDNKLIIKKALEVNAMGIILSHNHPSGNPSPSSSDIKYTQRLKEACAVMDIKLVDHVIICDSGQFYSFNDERTYN